jgi:hypothetical protein
MQYSSEPPIWMQNMMEWMMQSFQHQATGRQIEKDSYPMRGTDTPSRYGNCVLKNCRPDVHPPWSGRAKPYMEITCNGRATVRTSVSHRPDAGLKQERFLAKFLENPVAQLSVRTASVHITAVAHSAPQPINRGPWALRTARIQ